MESALRHCAGLKAIFRRQSAAWLDRDALHAVHALCRAAAQDAEDPYCRAELGRVEHYARQLLSHRDRRSDGLRQQILLTVDSIEDRLYQSDLG